jgi:hypothetical protein
MIMAPIIGAAVSALPALFKGFEGIRQRRDAEKGLASLERPEYTTPEEVNRMLGISQMRYSDSFMPGQGMLMDRIDQQAANAFAQGTEAGNPFALISNIQGQAGAQYQDLQARQMQQKLSNEAAYQQALMQMSQYKDLEWQMNEFAPYKDKYTELRDIYGAGTQNMYGALDSLSAIGTGLIGNIMGGGMGLGGNPTAGSAGSKPGVNQGALNQIMMNYQAGQGNQDAQAVQSIFQTLMNAQKVGG